MKRREFITLLGGGGGLAACGAGAAGGQAPDYRLPRGGLAFDLAFLVYRFQSSIA